MICYGDLDQLARQATTVEPWGTCRCLYTEQSRLGKERLVPFPFEVNFDELQSDLESEFLVMSKGKGFVEFPAFEYGYEALKHGTVNFRNVTLDTVAPVVFETPIALVVLRCMLGFTPPEWAYYATQHTGVEITQSAACMIDRNIRMEPKAAFPKKGSETERRIRALIAAACHALEYGVPERSADTKAGLVSVRSSADLGVPYSILLYERLLGRPFAVHRDSISELVGQCRRERRRRCAFARCRQLPQDQTRGASRRFRPSARLRGPQEFNL